MTIYEQTAPGIWTVDSPLNEYYEEEAPLRIGYRDLPREPIQQRMIVILLVVTAALLIFAFLILPGLLRDNQSQLMVNNSAQLEAVEVEITKATCFNAINSHITRRSTFCTMFGQTNVCHMKYSYVQMTVSGTCICMCISFYVCALHANLHA